MQPPETSKLLSQAITFHKKGDLVNAERLYLQVRAFAPDNFDALHLLGILRHQQTRYAEALELIGAALQINPDSVGALSNHGLVLQSLGQFEDALASHDRALALSPNHAVTLRNRGDVLRRLRRHEEALASYDVVLAINPDDANAANNRGNTLRDLHRFEEALASYDLALALKPGNVEALNNRGGILIDLKRPMEALASYDKALALKPDDARILNNRCSILLGLQQFEKALASCDRALEIDFHSAEAHNNRGIALTFLGRMEEARGAFQQSLAIDPGKPNVYLNYTDVVKIAPDDPHLNAMEAMADGSVSLDDSDKLQLDFALGKAYADLKNYKASFERLLRGNAMKRAQIRYDEASVLARFDAIERIFTRELVREKEKLGGGAASPTPIFILGMMRSGSTLVEQILASHPGVWGAGELQAFKEIVNDTIAYPESVPGLDARSLGVIGARYLDEMRKLAPAAMRVTDKMPANFFYIGLIHLALPNARIIHTMRDPIDTCVSCFSKLFSQEQNHTYDLGEMGRYYRHYQKLMAHWRRILPPDRMLEVRYEDVVADLEGQARRIIAHCGLAWDARCLSFHEADRPVSTASASQVRQPIYGGAVGRARAYDDFIGPLKEALAGGPVLEEEN